MLKSIKVEGEMEQEYLSPYERERAIEEILVSSREPVAKVQQIMALGVEEEDANDMVERYQIGHMTPVYYERLELFREEPDESAEE